MQHIPPKNKKGKKLSVCFLIFSCIGLVGASVLDVEYRVFYQLIAVMAYVFSFELLNRYYFSTYSYHIEEKDFIIRSTTGKRTKTLCNLSLSTLLAIEKKPKTKAQREDMTKRYGKSMIHYNYCQSFMPTTPYVILFEFNGKVAKIAFEPNEAMVCYLNELLRTKSES